MNIEFNVTGFGDVQARIRDLIKNAPQEVADALAVEAEIERTEAVQRTPVDTGTLRGSARVVGPEQTSEGIEAKIVFGGAASDYAVYVHERLDVFHPVGQAKFLESTLLEAAPHLARRVANRIDLRRAVR